jgi:hypothetical protein
LTRTRLGRSFRKIWRQASVSSLFFHKVVTLYTIGLKSQAELRQIGRVRIDSFPIDHVATSKRERGAASGSVLVGALKATCLPLGNTPASTYMHGLDAAKHND